MYANEPEVDFRRDAVALQPAAVRARFIMRVYGHLLGAIFLFVALEAALFQTGLAARLFELVAGHQYAWLLALGGFMVVGWFASHLSWRTSSRPAQYAALIGYVAAQALLFAPMLYVAHNAFGPKVIPSAALATLICFAGLTMIVFVTRQDFSFLRGIVMWGFLCAMVGIVAAILFGFELGTWFSVAMVALAGAAILYDTSNVLHHFPEDRYVGASLELFSSVAVLFWYILRLFMSRD